MRTISSLQQRNAFVAIWLFLVLAAAAGCRKEPPPAVSSADGTLRDESGNCMSATVHGRWTNGLISDTSYVEIGVNVTKPGAYSIITDKQDGVVFSATGTFTDTGYTTIHLKPTGLFTNPGQINFVTAFNASFCQMSVTVMDSAYRNDPDNTWSFTAGGQTYQGTGSALYTILPGAGDTYTFYGSMAGYTDTSLIISYYALIGRDSSGAYPTNGSYVPSTVRFTSSRSAPGPRVQYLADWSTPPAVIRILPINNGIGTVTFDGTARDSANNIVPITNARFRTSNVREVNYY